MQNSATVTPDLERPLQPPAEAPGSTRTRRRSDRHGGKPRRHGAPTTARARTARPDSPAALVRSHAGRAPAFPREFVPRPRLTSRLTGEREASLVLITAPAGYGKTTLLAEWAREDDRVFAWLTLSAAHDDPAFLLESIAGSLADVDVLDHSVARRLAKRQAGAKEASLAELLKAAGELSSEIGTAGRSLVLVLDDVQVIRGSDSRTLLKALTVGLSSGALLALASRTAPALPLGRMRAARALVELDAAELALSDGEARSLLRSSGLDLGDAACERLLRLTEGWPAALAVSAQVLRAEPEPRAVLERFAGDHEALAQYAREEVLEAASPRSREFLMRASIFERLSADACDAVLERTDSGSTLSHLATGGLGVTPLDSGHASYRLHPLLRAVLRAELRRADPAAARLLARKASDWYLARGQIEEAAEHAVATRDPQRAGELIWEHRAASFTNGGEATIARWLAAFDEDQLASSAQLSLCAAHRQLADGDLGGADHWARVAVAALQAESARTDELRSLVAGIAIIEAAACRHGLPQMAQDAERAYALQDEASPWRCLCALLGGVADHLRGKRHAAWAKLEDGVRRSARLAPRVESLCLAQLALMALENGELEYAAELAEDARIAVDDDGHPTTALVLAIVALMAAEGGHADEAKHNLGEASHRLGALGDFMPWYEVEARVALARACVRLADIPLARTLLAQASRAARRTPDVTVFRTWLDGVWAELDGVGVAALSGACALTTAELRILRFLPTHLSFREIGGRLHVSTNTVKSQAHAIYGKLGVSSRSDAVARGSELGLIEAGVI